MITQLFGGNGLWLLHPVLLLIIKPYLHWSDFSSFLCCSEEELLCGRGNWKVGGNLNSRILDLTPARPAVQIQKSGGNVQSARLGSVGLQRPEAHRASAVSAFQRANGEEKTILAPGVTSLMTIFFSRSDLHSHMIFRASYKISEKKPKWDGRGAENIDKCTTAELLAKGSPAVAELPFSPALHTDAQARFKK